MKKLLLILILLGLVGGAGFVGYKFVYPMFAPPAPTESEQVTEEVDTTEPTEEEIIIEEEDATTVSAAEEVVIETESPTSTTTKRKVPVLSEKKLFENTFVRFAYPSNLEIQTKTMNSLEVFKDTKRIGTIAIYNNDESLALEAFLQKDNLVDYFTESAKFNIKPTELDIPTAVKAFMFKDFPGFVPSDIVVIEFDKLILIVTDWSDNDIIQEYLVPSIEKLN
jgi:hypothetical protein